MVADYWSDKVFLNIVLDDAVEEKEGNEKVKLGMVVSGRPDPPTAP